MLLQLEEACLNYNNGGRLPATTAAKAKYQMMFDSLFTWRSNYIKFNDRNAPRGQ